MSLPVSHGWYEKKGKTQLCELAPHKLSLSWMRERRAWAQPLHGLWGVEQPSSGKHLLPALVLPLSCCVHPEGFTSSSIQLTQSLDRIRQDQVKTKWPKSCISPPSSSEVSKVTPLSPGTTLRRSCLPKGCCWGYQSSLTHDTASFQMGQNTHHYVCSANGAFSNQSQLFVLSAPASQGIALHGSVRTAVI